MSWTQPICEDCWRERYPGREPVRLVDAEAEACCYCGRVGMIDIYVRVDPATLDKSRPVRLADDQAVAGLDDVGSKTMPAGNAISRDAVQAARDAHDASSGQPEEEAMEAAIIAALKVELPRRGISWADAFGPSYSNPEKI